MLSGDDRYKTLSDIIISLHKKKTVSVKSAEVIMHCYIIGPESTKIPVQSAYIGLEH